MPYLRHSMPAMRRKQFGVTASDSQGRSRDRFFCFGVIFFAGARTTTAFTNKEILQAH